MTAKSGYVPADELKLYYEIHGTGQGGLQNKTM